MGFMKKKELPTLPVPPGPVAEVVLAMNNSTTLSADESGEFCHALFQTDEPLSPEAWRNLVSHARNGGRFILMVFPPEAPSVQGK